MNAQPISSSFSSALTFNKSFGSVNQPSNNEVKASNQAKSPIENSVKPSQSTTLNKTKETGSAMSTPSFSFSRTESLNLQIKTKEGDLVTIRFNRMESSHSGVLKMDQNHGVSGGKDQPKAIKSETNLNIDKGELKPASPHSKQKEVLYEATNVKPAKANDNVSPKTIEAKKLEPGADKKPADLASISHMVPTVSKNKDENDDLKLVKDASANPSKVTGDTSKNKVVVPQEVVKTDHSTSPNKMTASSRSELQMEHNGNKLVMTSEQTYSFESAKHYKAGGNSNNTQNINSQRMVNPSPKPEPSNMATDKMVETVNPKESDSTAMKVPTNLLPVDHFSTDNTAMKVPTNLMPVDHYSMAQDPAGDISKGSFQDKQSIIKEDSNGGSYSFNSDFNLSIEGDLNAEEQQSISELLKAMSQVSQDFFQGNVNAAFSQAQNLGLETEQIAGFSMEMNSQKSVQAMAAYQQTKMPEQNVDTNLLSQASDFLAQAKKSMAETKAAVDSFAAPEKSFTDMFAGVGQMFSNDQGNNPENNSGDMFLKIVENISSDLFSSNKMS